MTSSDDGRLLRIDPTTRAVEDFLPPGALPDPNGITVSADGRALYIACWYTVARVELETRRIELLDPPRGVASDGLYLVGGDLVGVQNCVHDPGRVVRLAGHGRRIVGLDVLESSNPLFDGITTAAPAGEVLYLPANSQFRKLKSGAPFDTVKILRVPLPKTAATFGARCAVAPATRPPLTPAGPGGSLHACGHRARPSPG